MIRSMTAFSRVETRADWGHALVEIRSVNQRFLDVQFRLPESFRYLETEFRQRLRKQLSRGKVECSLNLELSALTSPEITLNTTLAEKLLGNVAQLKQLSSEPGQIEWTRFLQWPDMVSVQAADLSDVEAALLELFEEAISELLASREREGAHLKLEIEKRLLGIGEQIDRVNAEMPAIIDWQRQRIQQKFNDAGIQPDTDRVEQELVMMAQKLDVAEEMDRLQIHVKEFERILATGGAAGRRMDFLLQELNREANTLGSKSVNPETTSASVELKVLLEQIREQIQNIE